jgi:hypothetical protein
MIEWPDGNSPDWRRKRTEIAASCSLCEERANIQRPIPSVPGQVPSIPFRERLNCRHRRWHGDSILLKVFRNASRKEIKYKASFKREETASMV